MADPPKPKDSGKRVLALLAVGLVLLSVYGASFFLRDSEYYEFSVGVTMIYYTALPLLIVLFVLLNRGISNDIPKKDQLSDSMTSEEKDAFIREIKECRDRARPLLILIIPLALIVGFDILHGFLF